MSNIFDYNGQQERKALEAVRKEAYKTNYAVTYYESLKAASLIKDAGYEPYLNTEGIRFPTQLNHNIREAKKKYIEEFLKTATFYAKTDEDKAKWAEKLAEITLDYSLNNGGATVYPGTGIIVKGGYAIGGVADTVEVGSLTYEVVLKYIIDHYDNYFKYDDYVIGTWYDEVAGVWDLDVSTLSFNEDDAKQLTSDRGEKAYYDLNMGMSKKADGTEYKKED